MRTKLHIITGGTSHEVPNTDIKNWDEIKYTLERKDFSGVMRYFSTEFAFVGETFALLRDLYLAYGFLAVAEVAVSTKNNDWTYTEQFRCPLDFSSIQIENGTITINAIDNTLAGLLKSKKGQKYEFLVDEFMSTNIEVGRIAFGNYASYKFPVENNTAGLIDVRKDDANSIVISTSYVEPADESTGYDGTSVNRFFAKINTAPSPLIRIDFTGYILRRLLRDSSSASELQLGYWVDDSNPRFQLWSKFCDNDISKELRYGSVRNKWIGKSTHANYRTLDALKSAAAAHTDIIGLYPGYFGVVGTNEYPNESYWTGNTVYVYYGGSTWRPVGSPDSFSTVEYITASASMSGLGTNNYPMLHLTGPMRIMSARMKMSWTDPANATVTVGGITPAELLQRIVESIAPGATSAIADDEAGLLANTFIFPAESLRKMGDAKVYSTFQQFADWMGAVFGYTYRVTGNEVRFLPRSDVFSDSDVKVIAEAKSVKYEVDTNLIYSEVDAGYSKKEYGEINGRLETNFTNYYATGYNANDRKLSLISKYRADAYGIEFTLRKGEKEDSTKDDKSDEDVFFAFATEHDGTLKYAVGDNAAYAPAVCVANNAGYIAAMGNGAAVVLTMTSSDGNNALANVTIPAGTALFTAGRLSFVTDDMIDPVSLDGLIEVERDGFRIRGYISKAEARFGRQNGMEYELIIKDITKL